jgi:mono/diheme cytochrome c family protein
MAPFRARRSTGTRVLRAPVVLVTVLLLAAGVRSAHAQAAPAPAQQPAADAAADTAAATDEVVDAGRKIFHGKGTCHACHGDQLQGGPIAPSLRGPKWRHIDGTFEAILQRVRGGYPGSVMVAHPGGIDDAQTIQVATYVWAVSHGKAKP